MILRAGEHKNMVVNLVSSRSRVVLGFLTVGAENSLLLAIFCKRGTWSVEIYVKSEPNYAVKVAYLLHKL